MTRPYAESSYNSLKTAFKLVVADVGGIDALASCTRVQRGKIAEYGNIYSERFPAMDVVLDAETIGQTPYVTAALARAQGYELVPVVAREGSDLAVEMARIGRRTAYLFRNGAILLGGGTLNPDQRAAMIADLEDLRRACAETLHLIGQDKIKVAA